MNKQSSSKIEQKLNAVYAVNPAGDFVDRLEKNLLAQAQQGSKLAARQPWALNLRQSRPWLRFTLAGAVVLALAAALFATPQGRAWAQEIIHFFTRAASDTLPVPTPNPLVWVDITPGVTPPTPTPPALLFSECGDYSNPRCSIEQIRSKVNFPVMELGTVPEAMHFIGAFGSPDLVVVLYDIGDLRAGITITEEPWTGSSDLAQWKIGASAVVEPVQIGNVTGEYVRGDWSGWYGDPNYTWDPNVGVQTLHWVENGVFFDMQEWGPTVMIDKDQFIPLAESLTTEPVSAGSTPIPATATPNPNFWYNGEIYNLSLAQAGQQAGFNVLEPGRLPEILSFTGASYRPGQPIVRLLYLRDRSQSGAPDDLTVSEQLAPNPDDCKLCGFVVGDYFGVDTAKSGMTVGANAVVETVHIGSQTGQYVEGFWAKTNTGWVWMDNVPHVISYQFLRWQANGMAFELYYFGISLTKADLIAIAESMK